MTKRQKEEAAILSRVRVPRINIKLEDQVDENESRTAGLWDQVLFVSDEPHKMWETFETMKRLIAGAQPKAGEVLLLVGIRRR